MSSISTLEVAWEHKSLWSGFWSETWFCSRVAKTNKLDVLKWIREKKKCEWSAGTINRAAEHGNLEMVKYCVANECPIDKWACACAAENGHLACLKYLHEEVKAPWDYWSVYHAHENNQTECVQYLLDKNCPSPTWLAIRTWSTTRATRVVVVIIIIIIIVDKQTRKKLVY